MMPIARPRTFNPLSSMHNPIRLIALFAVFAASLFASTPIVTSGSNIPEYLGDISVTIGTDYGSGSGVIFSRLDKDGQIINFVWTAAHVVERSRTEREIVAPDGSKRTVVEFADAHVIKELQEEGRIVGRLEIDAKVIKYSDADDGEDLALLLLRKRDFIHSSARFYLEKDIPPIGSELYHVGSLRGQMGANSLTTGIISQTGRILVKRVFDQTTVTAVPGSSGGGVFLKDGRYIGMLVRGSGETFNFIVPMRRIQEFVKRNRLEWAIDTSVAMPSEDEIDRIPIEDNAAFRVEEKKETK